MNKNFYKFKKRLLGFRILKACLSAGALGGFVSGATLTLDKLEWVEFSTVLCISTGAGCAIAAFLAMFFMLWKSDKKLAREIDNEFHLSEKVQTAVAFRDVSGEMQTLQREDTESALADIHKNRLKIKRLWVYCLALAIGIGALTAGILIKEKEPYIPPEEVIPFEISKLQIAGIEELIKYVNSSQMEDPYKSNISNALTRLLAELKVATTEPEMQASLAVALTDITLNTYDSSSMTEILNELWATEEDDIRLFAKVLNTSHWKEPDWGDFAEKYDAFCTALTSDESKEEEASLADAEGAEPDPDAFANTLRWKMENLSRKMTSALASSKIAQTDLLYASIYKLANGGEGVEGLAMIPTNHASSDSDTLIAAVDRTLAAMTDTFYATISTQKMNTNVGEYTMTRLGLLFSVPVPEFERPDFVKLGEDINRGDQDLEEDDDENKPSSGGIGEGVQYGSDDLVLDPLTGEYVEYGTLYARYNTLMIEKLGDEKYGYTEEQKRAIEKYFALLYSGFKDEEK